VEGEGAKPKISAEDMKGKGPLGLDMSYGTMRGRGGGRTRLESAMFAKLA
jgi:hypothetical protein